MLRALLARVLPYPRPLPRWRCARRGSASRWRRLLGAARGCKPLAAMLRLGAGAAAAALARAAGRGVFPAAGSRRRAASRCCRAAPQPVLEPSINEAAIRAARPATGSRWCSPTGEGCCGALVHHMGREDEALARRARNIDAWTREIDGEGLDAILITASGCGTTIKDYGFMLRDDPAYAEKAARVSALAKDITEYLARSSCRARRRATGARRRLSFRLLAAAWPEDHASSRKNASKLGFVVKDVPEGHLCCGSAGTYNILQPELAGSLRERKVANIETSSPT